MSTIRFLTPADAVLYRDIRLEALRLHPEAFLSAYEDEALFTDADWTRRIPMLPDMIAGALAPDGNRLLGVGGLRCEPGRKQRHRAMVWGMYVRAEARGRGLAAALLAALVDQARGIARLESVSLSVESTNQAARTVYERAGFRTFGTDQGAVKLGPDQYYHAEMRVLDLQRR